MRSSPTIARLHNEPSRLYLNQRLILDQSSVVLVWPVQLSYNIIKFCTCIHLVTSLEWLASYMAYLDRWSWSEYFCILNHVHILITQPIPNIASYIEIAIFLRMQYVYVSKSILIHIYSHLFIRWLHVYSYVKPSLSYLCVGIEKCPTLSDPDSGRVFIISNGRVAIFTCNDGFVTVGNSYLQCINGKWSAPPPMCQPS